VDDAEFKERMAKFDQLGKNPRFFRSIEYKFAICRRSVEEISSNIEDLLSSLESGKISSPQAIETIEVLIEEFIAISKDLFKKGKRGNSERAKRVRQKRVDGIRERRDLRKDFLRRLVALKEKADIA